MPSSNTNSNASIGFEIRIPFEISGKQIANVDTQENQLIEFADFSIILNEDDHQQNSHLFLFTPKHQILANSNKTRQLTNYTKPIYISEPESKYKRQDKLTNQIRRKSYIKRNFIDLKYLNKKHALR